MHCVLLYVQLSFLTYVCVWVGGGVGVWVGGGVGGSLIVVLSSLQ